jgi:hypothetical protein
MVTRQRVSGALVAALGAIGVTASAYLNWYGGQDGRDIPLERLFQTDISDQASSYWNSIAVALAVVSLLGVLGALLLSRFVLTLGWLIGVAALALWVVMQANDDSIDFAVGDIETGAWVCAIALLVMVLGIAAMGSPGPDQVVIERPVPTASDDASLVRERPVGATDADADADADVVRERPAMAADTDVDPDVVRDDTVRNDMPRDEMARDDVARDDVVPDRPVTDADTDTVRERDRGRPDI